MRVKIFIYNRATGKKAYFYAEPSVHSKYEYVAPTPEFKRALDTICKLSETPYFIDENGEIHTDNGIQIDVGVTSVFVTYIVDAD
ncbi:MAG: hypothetical protein IKZ87_04960 [Actinomycetaceae bacterium]|nr:hypothetical protein [Actinomycetaceae bacterium]